jgi:ABC-type nitrate/sulfonate/bicarbonate transport system permease component
MANIMSLRYSAARIAGLIVPLLIWEMASRFGIVNPVFLPPVSAILRMFVDLPFDYASDFIETGFEIAVALTITTVFGVAAGLILAQSETVDAMFGALMWFLYSAPLVAFTTFFIVVMGVGPSVPIALGVMGGIVFVISSTRDGVREVGRDLINVGRVFGSNPLVLSFKIIIPAAIPLILAGLRVGIGRVLVGVIVGEFFASGGGLGYLIVNFGNQLDMVGVYAAVFWTVLASVALNLSFSRVERSFVKWRPV